MDSIAALPPTSATSTDAKITLTLLCNNACLFCYNREGKQTSTILDEARVHELIDEAAEAGCDALNFIGGEVTIVPYFERVLAHAGERFATVSINTNGRRFSDPEFARRCHQSGLTHIDISLHGPTAAVHDFVSGAPGAFEETTAGLRNLIALEDGPKVSITTLVLDWNYPTIAGVGELLAEIGIPSWRIKYSYGALGAGSETSPSEYIPPYRLTLPGIHRAVENRCRKVNVLVHDIPVCLLGDLFPHSSVFEEHAVARYTDEEVEAPVRVVEKWGQVSQRCTGCAAAAFCCKISPAYMRVHGDDELTPMDAAAVQALLETAGERDDAPRAGHGLGGDDGLSEIFGRMDAAAREEDWRTVREVAVEALGVAPGHVEAEKMLRRSEFKILERHVGRLRSAGDERQAAKTRRYMQRHYPEFL